jgi:hypothetical protein
MFSFAIGLLDCETDEASGSGRNGSLAAARPHQATERQKSWEASACDRARNSQGIGIEPRRVLSPELNEFTKADTSCSGDKEARDELAVICLKSEPVNSVTVAIKVRAKIKEVTKLVDSPEGDVQAKDGRGIPNVELECGEASIASRRRDHQGGQRTIQRADRSLPVARRLERNVAFKADGIAGTVVEVAHKRWARPAIEENITPDVTCVVYRDDGRLGWCHHSNKKQSTRH